MCSWSSEHPRIGGEKTRTGRPGPSTRPEQPRVGGENNIPTTDVTPGTGTPLRRRGGHAERTGREPLSGARPPTVKIAPRPSVMSFFTFQGTDVGP